MPHTSGKESKASPTASSSQEGEEYTQEESEEAKQVLKPVSHKALVAELRKQVATPLESCHGEALSSSEAAAHNARPGVNLLNILQQGWDLRSVCSLACCSGWLLPASSYSLYFFPSFHNKELCSSETEQLVGKEAFHWESRMIDCMQQQ